MQPFDLLGITIKSLAEIEKEVSKLPRVGAGGVWPVHAQPCWGSVPGTGGSWVWGDPRRKALSLPSNLFLRKETHF